MSDECGNQSERRPASLCRGTTTGRSRSPGWLAWSLLLVAVAAPALFVPFPSIAQTADVIKPGEVLALSRAVEIALKGQPAILASRYAVRATEARVGEAQANYYPQLKGTTSYSRISPATTQAARTILTTGGPITIPPTNTADYDQYSASMGLSQIVYDFGKTPTQVRISKLNAEAARFDLANVQQTVAFNVKQAYYNTLQAQRNAEAQRQTVKQFREHLEQAQGFFEVGTKARFDVTKAEVDLSNAQVNLIAAENQIALTRLALNNAMGVTGAPDYRLEEGLLYEQYELPFEQALAQAYAQRPDLLSQMKKKESSKQSISLARTAYWPALTANGNYEYSGTDFPLQNGWTFGASLSIPIFNGFLTRYQISEAEANFGTASANEQSLRLDIQSQVQQGYVNLRDAAERIKASQLAVRQAKENVDLASGRYEAGVGGPLEVTDAIVAQSNAELTYSAALRDYKNAQAAIEKAIGAKR